MPNTVLEALAYGLPCIVTNYGGAKEAVGDAGIIIKNDPDHVAWDPDNILPVDDILFENAIKEFQERLPELRIKARERVLSELNDYVCANRFKEVFQTLL
jgi:glycosyltransferase involved in cell wall biosynthesis